MVLKSFTKAKQTANRLHPTQKSVELFAWCIERCGDAKLIADPYVGSGTTIMACEALGRRCFACEIEPAYVDVCLRRYVAKYPDADPVRHDGTKWSELT
jgi:DNA modification methylase